MSLTPALLRAQVNNLLANGKPAEALRLAADAEAAAPQDLQIARIHGDLLMRLSRPVEAELCFRKILAEHGQQADVLNRLAAVLQSQRRSEEALMACHAALQIEPDNPEIHANLGNIQSSMGQLAAAESSFRRAIEIAPAFHGALLNLGNLYKAQKRYAEAEQYYLRVVQANPRFLDIYIGLAECCLETGEPDRALPYYDRALSIDPGFQPAHLNRALACNLLGKHDEALASLDRLLRLDPGHAEAMFNRGLIYKRIGQYDLAAESLASALRSQPENPDIQLSLGLLELLRGHYRAGWRLYAARKSVRNKGLQTQADLPLDLAGREVLLLKDQGLGDELFFLRFAAVLKARNARISYQCDRKLGALLKEVDVIDRLLVEGEPAGSADYTFSVGDLPQLLGFNEDQACPQPLALPVNPLRTASMRSLLEQSGPPPWIGISWWAGTRSPASALTDRLAYREIALELLEHTTRECTGTYVVLQRNPSGDELDWLRENSGRSVLDASHLNDGLEDMLALLGQLHEYIGVDNTNMHLAAGIGKACRILVPHPPEWRMQLAGRQTPWFPGSVLYRQTADGAWDQALASLRTDLQQSLPGK